jgi:hypothetical protein
MTVENLLFFLLSDTSLILATFCFLIYCILYVVVVVVFSLSPYPIMFYVSTICERKSIHTLIHTSIYFFFQIEREMEVTNSNQRKNLPRSLQFQRMERIVKAMQHPTAGVPVRSQKLFLTTVPNAFTGNDMTEWIMQKLNVKDSGLDMN